MVWNYKGWFYHLGHWKRVTYNVLETFSWLLSHAVYYFITTSWETLKKSFATCLLSYLYWFILPNIKKCCYQYRDISSPFFCFLLLLLLLLRLLFFFFFFSSSSVPVTAMVEICGFSANTSGFVNAAGISTILLEQFWIVVVCSCFSWSMQLSAWFVLLFIGSLQSLCHLFPFFSKKPDFCSFSDKFYYFNSILP